MITSADDVLVHGYLDPRKMCWETVHSGDKTTSQLYISAIIKFGGYSNELHADLWYPVSLYRRPDGALNIAAVW